jgi:hypothetical protein
VVSDLGSVLELGDTHLRKLCIGSFKDELLPELRNRFTASFAEKGTQGK